MDHLNMRTYLGGAPAWVVAVVGGVLFGVIWTAATAVEDHRLSWHLLVIGAGAVVAVGMGFEQRRQRSRTSHIVGGLTAVQRRSVSRAVATGTPPQEPALRVAAVAMARDALAQYTRMKTATIAFLTAFAVVSALFVFDSWWYLVFTAGFVAAIVSTLRDPARLRKVIADLERAEDQAGDRRLATQ